MPSPMTTRRAAAIAALAATLIAPFEGMDAVAKPDRLAHGLPTVCYGMTSYDRPVSVGDTYSPDECMAFLVKDIPKYKRGLDKCIHANITNPQWAAAISLGYNIGDGAVCKSTFVKRLNAHDPLACDSILAYDRASGRVIRGLQRRRQAERKVCYTKD